MAADPLSDQPIRRCAPFFLGQMGEIHHRKFNLDCRDSPLCRDTIQLDEPSTEDLVPPDDFVERGGERRHVQRALQSDGRPCLVSKIGGSLAVLGHDVPKHRDAAMRIFADLGLPEDV